MRKLPHYLWIVVFWFPFWSQAAEASSQSRSGLSVAGTGTEADRAPTGPIRVYSHLLEPREHPDYGRRVVKPPDWNTFKNRTQFTCLRGFSVTEDRIVGYAEELEKYTRRFELGDVIWPSYPILFAKNLGDLADEIKRRDLYLFDVWGYVPGSGPGGYWQQFKPPAAAFTILESRLGDRWLGTDNGEQDGRYIGGYANQMTPAADSRFNQYLNFQRHFERLGDDLGHKHATLVSLNFGHYFLKEGTYTLIGAETAQALPNNQVYYAFIRGAGKQYGVPWFGNASIYNRWGFKTYGSAGRSDGYEHGPTKGTSLSLMKRLLYSHILYNSVAVGFENGWFEGDQLSPIGRLQQSAQRWVREYGQPGVMHTPVALLLDFYSGWTFPRHLYASQVYRVWGNLPYAAGDYFTDAVLELLYPGYQDSSFFHDETGFISATPYGDIADCLLSDAPAWVLDRYPVIIVAGELSAQEELRDKLEAYIAHGGHLVITAGNLAQWPAGIAGQTNAATTVTKQHGAGRLTVLATDFGVDQIAPPPPLRSENDKPLAKPYVVNPEIRRALDGIFRQQMLFEVKSNLSLITCRRGPGDYTLGVANNSWRPQPLEIVSHGGLIESIRELTLDQSEKEAVGYRPEVLDGTSLGGSSAATIAGGDLRLFAVRVRETNVREIVHTPPPARPRGRILPLRYPGIIKQDILARPTFFEHFDGVAVDWRYLHEREQAALRQEAGWLGRQGLRIFVDLSSGVNLYPELRLIDNLAADYTASMHVIADVLDKMPLLGAHDLMLTLHRHPENNFTAEQTQAAFETTLRNLAVQAADHQVTLHLRMAFGKPPWNLAEAIKLLEKVPAKNLRLAVSTALLPSDGFSPETAARLKAHLGLWLVAAARRDPAGQLWDAHYPVHRSADRNSIARTIGLVPQVPILVDAQLTSPDAEYLEARWLTETIPSASSTLAP